LHFWEETINASSDVLLTRGNRCWVQALIYVAAELIVDIISHPSSSHHRHPGTLSNQSLWTLGSSSAIQVFWATDCVCTHPWLGWGKLMKTNHSVVWIIFICMCAVGCITGFVDLLARTIILALAYIVSYLAYVQKHSYAHIYQFLQGFTYERFWSLSDNLLA